MEKAPRKDYAYVDKQGHTVQLTQRRYEWLQEQFQTDDWWNTIIKVPREVDEYHLLSPEMEHVVTKVLGLTTQGLATPFNAMRSMESVLYAHEEGQLPQAPARDVSPGMVNLVQHAGQLQQETTIHVGHTNLYALSLSPMLWVPVTVNQQTGTDSYTVTLQIEEWQRPAVSMYGFFDVVYSEGE